MSHPNVTYACIQHMFSEVFIAVTRNPQQSIFCAALHQESALLTHLLVLIAIKIMMQHWALASAC